MKSLMNCNFQAMLLSSFRLRVPQVGVSRQIVCYAMNGGVRWQHVGKAGKKETTTPHQPKKFDPFSASNMEPLQTVLDYYRFAVSQFHHHNLDFGHATLNAYEDASFLILHELALPYDSDIKNWFPAKLSTDERHHIGQLIKRRCLERIPTPYLVNGCYQQGQYFIVDKRVLIPRSFIGEIMQKWCKPNETSSAAALLPPSSSSSSLDKQEFDYDDYIGQIVDSRSPEEISNSSLLSSLTQVNISNRAPFDVTKVRRVLDLCTGSGCLAILAAKFFPNVEHVDAVDISSDALDVAEMNIESHDLEDIVEIHQGDLFKALPSSCKGSYDLIITNPPYVTTQDMEELPKEYQHEPVLALKAADNGTDIIKRILRESKHYLSPGGALVCEIGQTADALEKAYGKSFADAQGKVLHSDEAVQWISTELSRREVFYATKAFLEKKKF